MLCTHNEFDTSRNELTNYTGNQPKTGPNNEMQ
jgi:hypothetical protein